MNPTKFGSLNLDTTSSRYEFLNFFTKYGIINKENRISNRAQLLGAPSPVHPLRLIAGASRSTVPPISDTEVEDDADRRKLADGEVSGETPGTIMFLSLTHT